MILLASLIATAATAIVFTSGFAFGARRGRAARRLLERARSDADVRASVLETRAADLEMRAVRLSADLGAVRGQNPVGELRAELSSLAGEIRARQETDHAMQTEIRSQIASLAKQAPDPTRLERDLRRIVTPLLDREKESKGLQDMIKQALSPIVERDRLERELAHLEGGSSLGELPRLLDAIAEKAGLSAVVLSDDVGLPLASNASARSVEWLAGMSSLLLTLVERAERSEQPAPIGVVVHDSANQTILHRIFRVGANRFLLTAVSRGHHVSPAALDPALAKLERALSRPDAHA